MLKIRLRPQRYVFAEKYCQVVSDEKAHRDVAINWIANHVTGKALITKADLELPTGEKTDAVAIYSQNIQEWQEGLEVCQPELMGVIFGVEAIIPEFAGSRDAVFKVMEIVNDKDYIVIQPIKPDFGSLWVVNNPAKNK